MDFIFEHGGAVWIALFIIGFLSWVLISSAGFVLVGFAFVRAHKEKNIRSYVYILLSITLLVVGVPCLFVVYILIMGFLSVPLQPN